LVEKFQNVTNMKKNEYNIYFNQCLNRGHFKCDVIDLFTQVAS